MVEGQEGVMWEDWRRLARTCEVAGLEGLFCSDHYLPVVAHELEAGSFDAWTTLAALAATTQRIILGSLVSPVTFRHPSQLAKIATTVDHISGGRVELGVGAGWNEREHRAYGFPFPLLGERLQMLEEYLEVISEQWSSEKQSTYAGEYYQIEALTALPTPLQKPRPRLIVGGSGGRGTVIPAARFADEYNSYFLPIDQVRLLRKALCVSCSKMDRNPSTLAMSVMTRFVIGADKGEVLDRARRSMEISGATGDVSDFLRAHKRQWIIGTLEEVRTQVTEYERAGVERMFAQHLDCRDLDALHLLGRLSS